MNSNAFQTLIELDAQARDPKDPSEQLRALALIPDVLKQDPSPILLNATLLKLVDFFASEVVTNLVRLHIVYALERLEDIIVGYSGQSGDSPGQNTAAGTGSGVANVEQLVQRALPVLLQATDVIFRSLALWLLRALAPLIATRVDVRHAVIPALSSSHAVEFSAAVSTCDRLCELSPEFAAASWPYIRTLLDDSTVASASKARLIAMLRHRPANPEIAEDVALECMRWLRHVEPQSGDMQVESTESASNDEGMFFALSTLASLTSIMQHSPLHTEAHLAYLLSLLDGSGSSPILEQQVLTMAISTVQTMPLCPPVHINTVLDVIESPSISLQTMASCFRLLCVIVERPSFASSFSTGLNEMFGAFSMSSSESAASSREQDELLQRLLVSCQEAAHRFTSSPSVLLLLLRIVSRIVNTNTPTSATQQPAAIQRSAEAAAAWLRDFGTVVTLSLLSWKSRPSQDAKVEQRRATSAHAVVRACLPHLSVDAIAQKLPSSHSDRIASAAFTALRDVITPSQLSSVIEQFINNRSLTDQLPETFALVWIRWIGMRQSVGHRLLGQSASLIVAATSNITGWMRFRMAKAALLAGQFVGYDILRSIPRHHLSLPLQLWLDTLADLHKALASTKTSAGCVKLAVGLDIAATALSTIPLSGPCPSFSHGAPSSSVGDKPISSVVVQQQQQRQSLLPGGHALEYSAQIVRTYLMLANAIEALVNAFDGAPPDIPPDARPPLVIARGLLRTAARFDGTSSVIALIRSSNPGLHSEDAKMLTMLHRLARSTANLTRNVARSVPFQLPQQPESTITTLHSSVDASEAERHLTDLIARASSTPTLPNLIALSNQLQRIQLPSLHSLFTNSRPPVVSLQIPQIINVNEPLVAAFGMRVGLHIEGTVHQQSNVKHQATSIVIGAAVLNRDVVSLARTQLPIKAALFAELLALDDLQCSSDSLEISADASTLVHNAIVTRVAPTTSKMTLVQSESEQSNEITTTNTTTRLVDHSLSIPTPSALASNIPLFMCIVVGLGDAYGGIWTTGPIFLHPLQIN